MMKIWKTLPVALAGAQLMTGCGGGDSSDDGPNENSGVTFSLFAPTDGTIPFPFNALFADASSETGLSADATLNIPNTSEAPFVRDANRLDGFSTTASLFTDFLGAEVDLNTTDQGIVIINTATGAALTPGVDYQVSRSSVIPTRTRLLIQPLAPLAPATQYVVIVTRALRSGNGGSITPSQQFGIVSNPAPFPSEDNPAPPNFTPEQIGTLQAIRQQLIRPIFDNLIDADPDPTPGIDGDDVVLTWSFTTQSIGASLSRLNANAPAITPRIGVANTGLTTRDINAALPPVADVYAGEVDLPYYLEAASNPNDPAPTTTFWASDGTNAGGASPIGIPCQVVQPSESTTGCYPDPVRRSTQSVPVLVTVPNANSGQSMPSDGWPVVIFQHGITGDRSNMFAVAPALAAAGFVTVAIDLPLHGIVDSSSPLYQPGTTTERTFNLDLVNNETGAPGPDGNIDSSGNQFINLSSVITSRDNNRQAVSDLIQLTATVRAGDIPVINPTTGTPTGVIAIDTTETEYVGHSLGGIVGTVFSGVNSDVNAVTLAMPGGGIGRLLDGSAAFGPRIAAGLAASGVSEGTDNYETFLRFAQTLVDSGDPINYAAAANANHPIHLIEVVGGANNGQNPPDLVVPNFVSRNVAGDGPCPASAQFLPFLDTACEAGPLSGTNPLVNVMGLDTVDIAPPYSGGSVMDADLAVRFAAGTHSSILTPDATGTPGVDASQSQQTTCEMQSQTAAFLASAAAGAPSVPVEASNCSAVPQ